MFNFSARPASTLPGSLSITVEFTLPFTAFDSISAIVAFFLRFVNSAFSPIPVRLFIRTLIAFTIKCAHPCVHHDSID